MGRLEDYAELLYRWNRRINLVSAASLTDLWRRHMLDSAQLLPLLPPKPRVRARVLLDLGSGAGFPGLVLAILGAGEVHLVESDRRKATFLQEAARATETAVTIHKQRIESLSIAADVVTARALAPLDRLLGLARPFLDPEGAGRAFFLKGERVEAELTEAAKNWTMTLARHASRSDARSVILEIQDFQKKDGVVA
jgi:16S rRNA (guanine527-N7)-methyltransferase